MSARLQGLEANYAIFAALPDAAKAELKDRLEEIGAEALRQQAAAAPVRTGALKGALTVAEAVQVLRVRIGYPDFKGGRSKLFYAIFQEYGRRPQTVWARRLKRGARATWKQRIRAGGASGRVKPDDLVSAYQMHIRGMPARPFVHIENRIDVIADKYLAGFWDGVKARAGAA